MTRIVGLAAVAAATALAAARPAPARAEATTWNVDPAHSATQFSVKHLVVSTVRGQFGKTTGAVVFDEKDPARSSVEAVVDATTLDTRVPDRDKHLRSPDFFDVEKHPTITFRSTKVERAGEDRLKVTGDLTLKGTTRPVVFDVSYSPAVVGMGGETRRGFTGTARINRKDYGLSWSKVVEAGPVVGDEVAITIDLETVRAGTAQGKK